MPHALIALTLFLLLSHTTFPAQVESPCDAYTSPSEVSSPHYSPPFNLFSPTQELLIHGICTDSTLSLTAGNTTSSGTHYVYKNSYSLILNFTGWTPYTLSSTTVSPDWLNKTDTVSLSFASTQQYLYGVGCTCLSQNNAWKCCCPDAACAQGRWQLQAFQKPTTTSTTGGTATGESTGGTTGNTAQCPFKNDIFLNPFNKDSAHHRPIGTGAVYADADHPATRTWNTRSGIGINVGMPFGTYAVKSNPSDPLQTIRGTGYGLPTQLRLPAGFDPEAVPGRDSVVSLLTLDNREVHDLWRFEVGVDGFHARINRTYAVDGLGHPAHLGERLGVSASGVGLLFGALRGAEINTPGVPIRHALQMVIPGYGSNSMLSKEIRLPAGSMDNFCRDDPAANCLGYIPYGSLFALPPESKGDPDLHALGLSEPGLRLAEAIRDYGVYVVDDGGAVAIRADQQIDPQVRRQLVSRDIPKIYRHMRLVLNSAWTPGQQAVGGGTPLAPNCAFDAP